MDEEEKVGEEGDEEFVRDQEGEEDGEEGPDYKPETETAGYLETEKGLLNIDEEEDEWVKSLSNK